MEFTKDELTILTFLVNEIDLDDLADDYACNADDLIGLPDYKTYGKAMKSLAKKFPKGVLGHVLR